ncbi:MAG: glycosyl hydrolase family 2 [Prevotellaceae bacterium]|jgi:hypothetical protein|nr:glycosyl hydrolase family 2 [Prevotellaceae bacterium]
MKHLLSIALAGCLCYPTTATNLPTDSLCKAIVGFETPQDAARTKTWWFHGETETTREGITADLEAFKRVGIGGVVYYDQSHGPAENALPAFAPQWWEMLRFAAEEAQRVGLTFELHIGNGFVAGGNYIPDSLSMKRLQASQLVVSGGKNLILETTPPPGRNGYYEDVAVLAFPLPRGYGKTSRTQAVHVQSNVPQLNLGPLLHSGYPRLATLSVQQPDQSVDVVWAFEQPFTARSLSYEVQPRGKATTSATNVPGAPQETFVGTGYKQLPDIGQLEASDDGIHYRAVCNLKPIYRAHENWRQKSVSFAAVTARYFRLRLHHWWNTPAPASLNMGNVVLQGAACINEWEEKAGLFSEYIGKETTPLYAADEVIDPSQIINLTDHLGKDGVLQAELPAGEWMVMRFAAVPTGGKTKHGRKNLMGPECDKLSVEAAELQWNRYVGRILDSLRTTGSGHISGIAMDSHEAGAQNWTKRFPEEFLRRRGYDPTPYLPAMMGYVVKDVPTTSGFLYDVRRTIADLISDNYFGPFQRLCTEHGLTFTAQAMGNALCIDADNLQAKSRVDKPQGEFWPIHPDGNYDIKESSSAAHLYGKPIASAEAFTDAKYTHSPADLKTLADYAYAFGINEFVICASAYQPWLDKQPGSTGGGRQYCLNRNNTWWEESRPFWDYQARCAYLMRQGKSSADLCVYLGENAPVKILTYRLPDIPGGYDFDAFTSDALFTRMQAQAGRIVLPDGVSYRMMILPRDGALTLDALRRIASLIEQGARVYGIKPTGSPSARDVSGQEAYRRLTDSVWGETPAAAGSNSYGKGRIYWGMPLGEALQQAGIAPDVALQEGSTKERMIYFAHRTLADAELYFLANRKDQPEANRFTFPVAASYAQLWFPVSGKRFALPVHPAPGGGTTVDLRLMEREACFVVLTNRAEALAPPLSWSQDSLRPKQLLGWTAYFDPAKGGVGALKMDTLRAWTHYEDPRIRYYSGTVVYQSRFKSDKPKGRIFLQAGYSGCTAHLFVNGKDAGILWTKPDRVEITDYVHAGENEIEIRLTNTLMNRMLYDAGLPPNERITYSYPPLSMKEVQLTPSGLTEVLIVTKR